MEILAGVLAFLQILEISLGIRDKVRNSNDIDNISQCLTSIGNLLESVADDLGHNIYPHGKCNQMMEYLNSFGSIIKNKLTQDELERFHNLLAEAHRVEQLMGQLNSITPQEKEKNINLLKSIAGNFVAMGEIIKLR